MTTLEFDLTVINTILSQKEIVLIIFDALREKDDSCTIMLSPNENNQVELRLNASIKTSCK